MTDGKNRQRCTCHMSDVRIKQKTTWRYKDRHEVQNQKPDSETVANQLNLNLIHYQIIHWEKNVKNPRGLLSKSFSCCPPPLVLVSCKSKKACIHFSYRYVTSPHLIDCSKFPLSIPSPFSFTQRHTSLNLCLSVWLALSVLLYFYLSLIFLTRLSCYLSKERTSSYIPRILFQNDH